MEKKLLSIMNINKFIFFLFITLYSPLGAFAQSAGFNSSYAVFTTTTGANKYYCMYSNTACGGVGSLDGANLGTYTYGATGSNALLFQGAEHNVYKCGSADITSTRINYRIYPNGSPSGSFNVINIGFTSTNGNGCSGQDQRWSNTSLSTNLLTGLSVGNYTIEIYSDETCTNVPNQFLSNSSNNYKANFSITAAPVNVTPTASQSKIYGAANPTFTFSTSPSVATTGVLGRVAGENVNTYAYTLNTLSAGSNYSLVLSGSATFAISPASLTIAATNQSKCQGQNFTFDGATMFSTSPSSLPNGENVGSVTLTSSGANSGALAGSYNIIPSAATGGSFLASNYAISYVTTGVLTVNPLQTPTVALTSSDSDSTFAYGTPVTFTATASSVVGNTGIVYDFKVNGVSKQNGPSATYVVSTLANNDQVSVSIVVTGGTCMATNVATSASITNTVTGAVLVYISNYCGQTLPWLSAPINSTTAVVSGAPTVQYQFRVKRVGGASETLALRSTPSFNLTQSTLYAYNASYEVYVAAVINGVLQPESTACIISTPTTVPPVAVQTTYCGDTLADAYSPIFAVAVPGATGYSFDVYQGITHVTTVTRNVPYFYLTNIPGWTYNTVYTVFVAVKINDGVYGPYGASCSVSTPQLATPGLIACGGAAMTSVSNPVFTTGVPGATNYSFEISGPGITTTTINRNVPYFYLTSIVGWNYATVYTVKVTVTKGLEVGPQSAGCTLTTPAIPSTAVRASQCGQRMTNAATAIFADAVYGATEYVFTVTDGVNSTPITRSVNYFYINTVSFWEYNTDYTVSVEAKRNTGSYSPIVTTCIVSTPVGPMTTIPEVSCNNPTLTLSGVLSVDAYPGASSYLFTVELYNDLSQLIGSYSKVRYTNNVTLNMFPGLAAPSSLPGVTYSWGVQVGVMGKYGEATKGCSFTLIPIPSVRMAIVPFSATAYPNPFANNFMLDVKTNSQSVVNVKVYDMVGRMIEQREVRVSDMETTTIGDRYPSGVYNVVVAQEDTIETVRVIKR